MIWGGGGLLFVCSSGWKTGRRGSGERQGLCKRLFWFNPSVTVTSSQSVTCRWWHCRKQSNSLAGVLFIGPLDSTTTLNYELTEYWLKNSMATEKTCMSILFWCGLNAATGIVKMWQTVYNLCCYTAMTESMKHMCVETQTTAKCSKLVHVLHVHTVL